ncbi:putative DNA-binding domain-containing protein [Endozoicomonas sp. SM1973]|uniref:DNA-binding domain-containing protein n=1 Tax=Spartinivicinus marinus TaxID=2994442 RepID=A0A853IAT6_9GAMM|nr:DNA-binding domain-containing protein [Spartinivicinus marinus]NYZ67154.1 putative DNA-binding domain-containing protein [Spartinivicinus marinus]
MSQLKLISESCNQQGGWDGGSSVKICLSRHQQWFQAVTTHKSGLYYGLQAAEQEYDLTAEQMIVEGHIGSKPRLAIYANGYVARLLECLRADYSALCTMLGQPLFDTFARAYIMETPSSSFTLFELGKGFSDFLARTRPHGDDISPELEKQLLLPIELAKLERQRVELIRCVGHENDTNIYVDLDILPVIDNSSVALSKTARLGCYSFPLAEYLQKLDSNQSANLPEPKAEHLILYRNNYRVKVESITNWQYEFLLACKNTTSINQAIKVTANRCGITYQSLLTDIYLWLPQALLQGILYLS